MSKFARERKKHWRVILAEAKKQSIILFPPLKKIRPRKNFLNLDWSVFQTQTGSMFQNYIKRVFTVPNPRTNAKIIFPRANDLDLLRGSSIDYISYDEINIEDEDDK